MQLQARAPGCARMVRSLLRPAARSVAPVWPAAGRRAVRLRAESSSGAKPGGDVPHEDLDAILAKYGWNDASKAQGSSNKPVKRPSNAPKPAAAQPVSTPAGNGVFLLLLLNIGAFVADHVLRLPVMQTLYLNHAHPMWWQWLTHAFCHANWGHLSMNLFNLCVFGKLVEETEGAFGVIFTYVICALGAALVSVFTQPAIVRGAVSISLGASGAIFGLFMVSVLARMSWDPRRLLEGLILGWFVVQQVMQEAQAQVAGGLTIGGLAVGHLAHLGGALAGVLLVLALKAIPDPGEQ